MKEINKWYKMKNLLILRADNMGDVLMATPAIRALRSMAPNARIILATSSMGALAIPHIPYVDESIVADFPWVKTGQGKTSPMSNIIRTIKAKNIDGAIILTNYSQSALPGAMLCYMTGIPARAAYSRENPYCLLTDWIPDPEPFGGIKHAVQRQLDLVSALGAHAKEQKMNMTVCKTDLDYVRALISKFNINKEGEYIVMHPGASEKKRKFPINIFADAAGDILRRTGLPIFITGIADDGIDEVVFMNTDGRIISLISKLTFGQLVALISMAKLLISNNTGTVHIACALQTPVLVLYARTNPEHTPWHNRNITIYFDVEENMKSRNMLLETISPSGKHAMPTAHLISQAALKILGLNEKFIVPSTYLEWNP